MALTALCKDARTINPIHKKSTYYTFLDQRGRDEGILISPVSRESKTTLTFTQKGNYSPSPSHLGFS